MFTVFFAGKNYERKNLHTKVQREKNRSVIGAMNYGRKYKNHRGPMMPSYLRRLKTI
jgi:hypothetical protein